MKIIVAKSKLVGAKLFQLSTSVENVKSNNYTSPLS